MSSKENGYYKWSNYLFRIVLLGVSALATIKVVFFFTDLDEQYAIALAYRMVCGDRMFMEMWEPHQTSGFLAALLVKIYMIITGSLNGVVIYLRLCGVVFQGLVSVALYKVFKKVVSEDTAFVAALFYYNTLAKYNQTIDFANMLMWFSMLMFLALLQYVLDSTRKLRWLVLAGISTSLLVLSYPTCLLVVIPVCIGLWQLCEGKEKWKDIGVYLGTCALCGGMWLLYFLTHMSFSQFVYGVSQMMTDGSHSSPFIEKLRAYGGDVVRLIPYVTVIVLSALVLWFVIKKCFKRDYSILSLMLFASVVQQICIWVFDNEHIKFPGVFYFVLLFVGIYRYIRRVGCRLDKDCLIYRALFWFGSITAIWIFVAALIASNMDWHESAEYMMIGFVVSISYLDHERKQMVAWWSVLALLLVGVAAFRKGYLMHHVYGVDTIFVTKQKALDGPLSGVYCRYLDGYDYNMRGIIMNQYIPEGSTVLYVGVDTLAYLQGEYNISNFSTISTPSMDERLFEYWDRYPEKYPEYIVWDFKVPTESAPAGSVKEQLLQDAELLIEDEDIQIWKSIR